MLRLKETQILNYSIQGAYSWDDLYVSAHEVMMSSRDKNWVGLYIDEHGESKDVLDNNWDGFYR